MLDLTREDLIKLRDEGKSIRTIAEMYDCEEATIYTRCRKQGVPAKGFVKPMAERITKEVFAKVAYMSNILVAERLGISLPSVIKLRRKYGFEIKKQEPIDLEMLKVLYYEERLSAPEIARKFNCSGTKVINTMKRNNLPRRSYKEAKRIDWQRGRIR